MITRQTQLIKNNLKKKKPNRKTYYKTHLSVTLLKFRNYSQPSLWMIKEYPFALQKLN